MMSDIIVYTDGSFLSSRNVGGVGLVFVKNNKIIYEYNKHLEKTTNNRCELYAVIKALQAISTNINSLTIYSDSQYVINSINLGWQRKKNRDLWSIFDRYYEQAQKFCKTIEFKWVKGHNISIFNNLADKLAVQASEMYES